MKTKYKISVFIILLSIVIPIALQNNKQAEGYWTSSHKKMIDDAFVILGNDGGYKVQTKNELYTYIYDIKRGQDFADSNTFNVGHTWNPYLLWGLTFPTFDFYGAARRAQDRFDEAVNYYLGLNGRQVDKNTACEYLGWALHFVQDVLTPQHTMSDAIQAAIKHKAYENFAGYEYYYGRISVPTHAGDYTPRKDWYNRYNARGWVHQAAFLGYEWYYPVVNNDETSQEWEDAVETLIPYGIKLTAGFLFYFWQIVNDYDVDGDGVGGFEEYIHESNPHAWDTDGDGLTDKYEIDHGLDPTWENRDIDTDGDGLTLYEEYNAGSNPNLDDSDSDGWDDYMEVKISGTHPMYKDTDTDKLNDKAEYNYWISRGVSVSTAYQYCITPDADGDTLLDGDEYNGVESYYHPDANRDYAVVGCDPLYADTDGDTLNDYHEVFISLTRVTSADSDQDQLTDAWELNHIDPRTGIHFDPWDSTDGWFDHDADGLPTKDEVSFWGTHWNNPDTDNDGYSDCDELMLYLTNPLSASDNPTLDHDGDGLSTYDEVIIYGTDPHDEDTDGDGFSDYRELFPLRGEPSDPTDPSSYPGSTGGGGGYFFF
ncbi:MAG: hypothetical protein FK733_11770 [Asgard group archaeon]|nr:hypothetical protein [Asgard group archaeon]